MEERERERGRNKKRFRKKIGIKINIRRSRHEREEKELEIGSVKNKIELMKRKGGFKETGLCVENYLMEEEERAKE